LKSGGEAEVNAADGNRQVQAGLSAEELCEMARACVANVKGNIHHYVHFY